MRAKRVRIYPDKGQRNLFRQWFGTSRFVYNETVNHLNLPKAERENHWMAAATKRILPALPSWADPVPFQVKKIAVEDAYKAFSNGCRKAKQTGAPFKLSYRSRKDPKQSCYIPKSALKDAGIYPRIAGKLKKSEEFPDDSLDSRLVFEHGRWFVIVPYKVEIAQAESQGRAVAIDPGVRTFATCFSEGLAVKIGEGDFARIARLGRCMDDLISRMSKAKCRPKARMKKALGRMKWKLWDLVDEIHFKTINLLVGVYDIIILPKGGTSDMVAKSTRRIQSKTVRSMLTYAFHRFAMRLESKAHSLGKQVVRCSEAWTSQTASWTGEIKKIGSAKTIVSKGVKVDRDINGARGIFIRALGDTPLLGNGMHWLADEQSAFVSKKVSALSFGDPPTLFTRD
jgi:putative transposase